MHILRWLPLFWAFRVNQLSILFHLRRYVTCEYVYIPFPSIGFQYHVSSKATEIGESGELRPWMSSYVPIKIQLSSISRRSLAHLPEKKATSAGKWGTSERNIARLRAWWICQNTPDASTRFRLNRFPLSSASKPVFQRDPLRISFCENEMTVPLES